MRRTLILALAAGLAGCAGSIAANYPAIVGMIQTDYGQLTAAAAAYAATPNADPAVVAKIKAIEAKAGPEVAALTSTSAPTTITTAVDDAALLLTVPNNGISARTQADITLAVSLLNVAAPIFGL